MTLGFNPISTVKEHELLRERTAQRLSKATEQWKPAPIMR